MHNNTTTLLPLSGSRFALIDTADFARCEEHTWHVHDGYVRCSALNVKLHQFIMGVSDDGRMVDHRNRDKLDNRRENLRFATKRQNTANAGKRKDAETSAFKGVSFSAKNRIWIAAAAQRYLGSYALEVDAARAYDLAAVREYGEFASLNFPDDREAYQRGEVIAPTPTSDPQAKTCAHCGQAFVSKKATKLYCCYRCNQRAFHARNPGYQVDKRKKSSGTTNEVRRMEA